MLRLERRQRILDRIAKHGSASVAELARSLKVTEQTIRRDLTQMEEEGLIRRDHGGAVLAGSAGPGAREEDQPLLDRLGTAAEAKRVIGLAAAAQVRDGQTVIFDAGSTSLAVAEALDPKSRLTVITNALPIAEVFVEQPEVEVILAGGVLRHVTQSTVGPMARQAFEGLNADLLFLGATGVTLREGLTNSNVFESEVKRAMMEAARRVILVVDGSKFGQVHRHSFAPLSRVHAVVTDPGAPQAALDELAQAGIEVIVAGREP